MDGDHQAHSTAGNATQRRRRETFLPFARPSVTDAEIAEVVDTLRSGWLSVGPKTKRLEKEFPPVVGAEYGVAVNSATSGLQLALEAVGVRPGDEVIVPDYTFTASAMVVVHLGARPVIVDVSPVTANMEPAAFEAAITPRTKAVVVVDIAGLPAELDQIVEIAHAHGVAVVEDAAHAFPAKHNGRMIGSISDITSFSFYATKTLAVGDGGMLTTNNQDWARRMSKMGMHGMDRDAWNRYGAHGAWRYEITAPGYKFNMSDLSAALGVVQLGRRDWLLGERQWIARRYTEAFGSVAELETPPDSTHDQHAWHLYMLRLRPERLRIGRDEFVERLGDANIGVSVHFIPLHMHSYYRDSLDLRAEDYPGATSAFEREISLPIYPGMTPDDADDVVSAVLGIVESNRR